MFYVLISGKRDFTDYEKFCTILDKNLNGIEDEIEIVNDKYVGYIVRVFSPNKYHSGRFIVQVYYKYGSAEQEFWFGDYGVIVKGV